MSQSVFQTYSGPQFIVNEVTPAKGTQELPLFDSRVKWDPYRNSRLGVQVPFNVLTVAHEQGLLTENEKFELLEAPTEKPTLMREATRGVFVEHHQHRANLRAVEFTHSTRIPSSDEFYCKNNPETCMYCKRKAEVVKEVKV